MRGAGWLLVGILAGIAVVVLLFGDRETFHRSMDFNGAGQEDFTGFYHPTAAQVLETGRPTPGFLYPPSFALALTPLGDLEREPATRIWVGIQLGALALLLLLTLWILRPPPRLAALSAFLTLTSVPVAHSLHWGQVSLFIGVLVLCAVSAAQRRRGLLETLPLAGAVGIKLYPVAFLLPLGLRRGWRVAGGTLALCLGVTLLLPALVLGWEATLGFWGDVFDDLRWRRQPAFRAGNAQALAPSLGRWLDCSAPLAITLAALVAAAHVPLIWRSRHDPVLAYAATIAVLPLVVEPHWPHYLVLLPFLQTLALTRGRGDRVVLWLVVASVLYSWLPTFRAFPSPRTFPLQAYGRTGLLAIANLMLLAALWRLPHSTTRTS